MIDGISLKVNVVFEDDNIIVCDKPVGIEVESDIYNDLTLSVNNYLKAKNQKASAVHRIDRNTSGLVVFGKTSIALQELFKAFKNHDGMDKEYETLVCGKVTEKGKIEAKLIKNEKTSCRF